MFNKPPHRFQTEVDESIGHDRRREQRGVVPAEHRPGRNGEEGRHSNDPAETLPGLDTHHLDQGREDEELEHHDSKARNEQHLEHTYMCECIAMCRTVNALVDDRAMQDGRGVGEDAH